ncbi:MAG: cytochrome P450 [Myxococcales bacterium]|nr:cytochrome P450 [Myxococcales bacterium]
MSTQFENVDMCDPATHDEPWELYEYLRENDPLYWDPNNEVWYVFRYDDIVTVARDPETFCSTEGNRPNIPPDPSMIHQDGDQHTKQRALVSQGFTPRQMRKMDDHVHTLVEDMVEAMVQKEQCEIVEDLAAKLPMRLIGDMLGVPREKHDTVRAWIGTFIRGGQGPQYVGDDVNDAFGEFCEHHMEMIEEREQNPGDDLLSIWMNAELDGEKLNEEQLLFEHTLLNVGGAETTRNAIAGGLEQLAYHPEQWDYLSAHPEAIPNACEEIVRWVTPFLNMFRTATRDVEMHGKVIKEGQMVGMQYPAANRDPRHFKNPYEFDVCRDFKKDNSKHIAFGYGSHFCLGSSLARLELRHTLEVLTRRVKRIRVPEGEKVTWVSSSFVRGPARFPAILELR